MDKPENWKIVCPNCKVDILKFRKGSQTLSPYQKASGYGSDHFKCDCSVISYPPIYFKDLFPEMIQ